MLDWEGQGFDLQEIRLSKNAIEIHAQGMSGKLGMQASTQAPARVGMVDLDMEMVGELCIDGLDHLAHSVEEMLERGRQLLVLIATRQGPQLDAVVLPQLSSLLCADVGFIAQHLKIVMLAEQLEPHAQISLVGGCKTKSRIVPFKAIKRWSL